ncbi:MAG: efflux transporter outer membrane subunit [Verrucomicrobiae bacterium]|nr:efflux transporter outer membrane subunit [Verrucomicrobiae bacterium]
MNPFRIHRQVISSRGETAIAAIAGLVVLLSSGPALAQFKPLGPDYERPATSVPERFKNVAWRAPSPSAHLTKGEWWRVYSDSTLDELLRRATANNQELKGAIARFDQARTSAHMSKSDLLPRLALPASAERQRTSENMPSAFPLEGLRYDGPAYNALVDFGWEIDLWGKLRRKVESDEASTLAAADQVHNVLLGIQAEVAATYFQIRALDVETAIVREAVGWRGEALKIARARVTAGAANDLEQAQAETEVATAEAEISVLQSQRDQLENVLALLVGANASSFALAAAGNLLPGPPEIPAGFPSDLLERRTDIAAAEQQLAAATARIGMAEAEFFPSVSLMGNGGFQSGDIGPLLDVNSLMWTFGPRVRIPVFSGGKDRFNLSRSHAAHDEALAAYRQAFLVAVGDVETSLSNLRHLGTEAKSLGRARDSAVRASRLARTQYELGTAPYLDVITANRTALTTQLAYERVAGQRLVASVALVKALGGGWDQSRALPMPEASADPVAKSNPEKTETPLLKRLFQKSADRGKP